MTDGLVKYVDAASRLDWGPVCTPVHSGLMTKLAAECHTPDALLKVIESLRERPEGVYVLITALGAYEYWGVNRNGDAFPEWSLKGLPPPADVAEYLAGAKFREKYGPFSVPTGRYGHATFVTDAKAYILHANSDPTRSVGDVIASAYNEHMHRVELVLFIYEARDPDGVRMLREGRPTPFSMGAKLPFDNCLLKGSSIYTPDGPVAVEDLEVDDVVWTDRGRPRRVTQLFRRSFSGTLVTLTVGGLLGSTTLTDNHPVKVYRAEQLRSCRYLAGQKNRRHTYDETGCCRICREPLSDLQAEFVRADTVRPDDYVMLPKVTHPDVEPLDPALARLCGYYLGDGTILTQRSGEKKDGPRKFAGVSICCHVDETEHIARVVDTFKDLSEHVPHVYDAGDEKRAVTVVCNDPTLAAIVAGECGRKKDKRIPTRVFGSSREAKLALLGGLIDTDGHVDPTKKATRFSNVLAPLIRGVQLLAMSVGIPATASGGRSVATTFGMTTPLTVYLGVKGTSLLRDHSVKCSRHEPEERWSATTVELPNEVLLPVRLVTHTAAEDVEVFNFSVEEDETYVVDGFAVHNCSICLNPARNRTQYCEHLRTQMNQILPDGRKVFTFNWFPRYFDISRVRVPADPSAWALRKVAGVGTSDVAHAPRILVPVGTGLTKVAGLLGKTGTLTKETPPTVAKPLGSAPIDPDLLSLVRAQVAADDAPELRDEALEAAGRTDGFGALLTALATAGIVLRPSEFSRMQAASGEKMPARLDAQVPSLRLLMLVRRHVPQRSMVEPEFSERRKTASVPARPTTAIAAARDDDGYARYLACLRDVVDDVVKIAESPDVRIRLRPDWAGRMLFKQAGHPAGPTAWLPFLVSLVPTVR